ncbi:MAG TPA: response regulator transcription factor [Cyclobacteriaceae bacterium]|nr:response regulator transcription factor [Cyclobacteriaceae bacterium]
MKILIIEDEAELLRAAAAYLTSEGYICEGAGTYREAVEKIRLHVYDCVIADIGLPDGTGLDLVDELRSRKSETGVIIISARNSLEDKVNGLDLGADDYLTKPFHLSELNARLKSLLRRRKFQGKKEIEFNEILIAPDSFHAFVNHKMLVLTRKEFNLLIYFVSNKGKIITKESIAEHLWGDYIDSVNSHDFIYNHISNLRRKLLETGSQDYIQTVYGVGYKFAEP